MLRLALAFGIPPREMLARMSAYEIAEYRAIDSIMPIGDLGDYYRTGMLTMASAGDGKHKYEEYLFPTLRKWLKHEYTDEERVSGIANVLKGMTDAGIAKRVDKEADE